MNEKKLLLKQCNQKLSIYDNYQIPFIKMWLKKATGRKRIDPSIVGWNTGLLCDGIIDSSLNDNEKQCEKVIAFYDNLLKLQKLGFSVFFMPDSFIHASCMSKLIIRYNKKHLLPLVNTAIDFYKCSAVELSKQKYVIPFRANLLYLDQIGIMGEFCQILSDEFGEEELLAILLYQIYFTFENQIEQGELFPAHVFDLNNSKCLGSCTWGRGVGWWMMGLIYASKAKNTKESYKKEMIRYLLKCSKYLSSLQDEKGYLYDDIRYNANIDTSTTAICGWCFSEMCLDFTEYLSSAEYTCLYNTARKCKDAIILSMDRDGKIMDCSMECKDFGQYSKIFGDFCAEGPALKLMINLEILAGLEKTEK